MIIYSTVTKECQIVCKCFFDGGDSLILHQKREWCAFLFTNNNDMHFYKEMIWCFALYCKPYSNSISYDPEQKRFKSHIKVRTKHVVLDMMCFSVCLRCGVLLSKHIIVKSKSISSKEAYHSTLQHYDEIRCHILLQFLMLKFLKSPFLSKVYCKIS